MPTDPALLLQQLQGGPQTPDALIDTLFGVNPAAQVVTGMTTRTRTDLRHSYTETVPTTRTVADLIKDFYTIDGDNLRQLQQDLFVGGFYGDSDPSNIQWGRPDDATYRAYTQAVVRASRYYAAGKKLTVDDVLDLAAETAGEDRRTRTPQINQLSDPAGLGSTLDDAARKVLGRKATVDEKRLFTAAIHAAQKQSAATLAAAADAQQGINPDGSIASPDGSRQTTTVVGVDPGARAEQFIRGQDPTRAGARDVLTAFSAMADMFGGN